VSYRCPACRRRVRCAPYVRLQDKHTRKITRYHGNVAGCLEAVTVEAQRRGPGEIVLGFYLTVECGDSAGRMGCRGGCFKVDEAA
jgi:hypothetical protein